MHPSHRGPDWSCGSRAGVYEGQHLPLVLYNVLGTNPATIPFPLVLSPILCPPFPCDVCMCVCVSLYVCVCLCLCSVYMFVGVCLCLCVCVCVFISVYLCVYLHLCMCFPGCVFLCVCLCTWAQMLEHGQPLRPTSLKKADSSCPTTHPLPGALQIRVGPHGPLSIHAGSLAGWNLSLVMQPWVL